MNEFCNYVTMVKFFNIWMSYYPWNIVQGFHEVIYANIHIYTFIGLKNVLSINYLENIILFCAFLLRINKYLR